MNNPYASISNTGTIQFPLVISANDYHEFNVSTDLLRMAAGLPEPAPKKRSALDYYELGFIDGSYKAIVYSPLNLGRELDWKKDRDFLIQQLVKDYLNETASSKKSPKTPPAQLKHFMVNCGHEIAEQADATPEHVQEQFMAVLFERDHKAITKAVAGASDSNASKPKRRTSKI